MKSGMASLNVADRITRWTGKINGAVKSVDRARGNTYNNRDWLIGAVSTGRYNPEFCIFTPESAANILEL